MLALPFTGTWFQILTEFTVDLNEPYNAQSNCAAGVGLPFLVITAMPDTHLGHVNTAADKTDDPCDALTTNRLLTC